jgi:hypothetical protein
MGDDFDDAGALRDDTTDAELAEIVDAMVRADLAGTRPGAIERTIAASPDQRARLAYAYNDAIEQRGLGDFIAGDERRRARAIEIVSLLAPPDPSIAENALAIAELQRSSDLGSYEYPLIIVPGYTPRDSDGQPVLHEVARRRLDLARDAFTSRKAPFVLLSGGAVHPRGTCHSEALLMKEALLQSGFPADRVLVDARARHTTTNLRNAGRFLLANGLERALVVTVGGGIGGSDFFGQDFYLKNPTMAFFHWRCEKELGYRVGALTEVGEHHIAYSPAPEVTRVSYRDALDP